MAGATPNLAIPYPTGTDRVADGDNAMQALAERVEARMPWGSINSWYAQNNNNVPFAGGGANTDLCSVTFTAAANRRYRLSAHIRVNSGASAFNWYVKIVEGASTDIAYASCWYDSNTYQMDGYLIGVVTPAAGAHTYKLSVSGNQSGNSIGANVPAFILVEDVGPAV